jgi:N-acetylglucosamine-6-sulfatase
MDPLNPSGLCGRTGGAIRLAGLALSLLLVGAGALAPSASAGAAANGRAPRGTGVASKPNILFILTDDQRFDELDHMPIVDANIIGKGVEFPNGMVSDPLCCPSRATILTGTYSHTNGIYTNQNRTGAFKHFVDTTTIATVLSADGYHTGLIGKYFNGYTKTYASYIPPGWDRWFALTKFKYFGYSVSDQGTFVQYPLGHLYQTDILGQQAVDFVNAAPAGQPLFLYWAPYAPHGPARPKKKYAGTLSGIPPLRPPSYNESDVTDKPAYVQAVPPWTKTQMDAIDAFREKQYESLLSVDDWVDSILQALRQTGRLSNTLIVLMGDNGHLLGEHRLEGKEAPYEESIKVPFVVRWDAAGWNVPRTDNHIVANVDLAETWAQAAGTTMPGNEGLDMLPLLADPSSTWRSSLLLEHGSDQRDVPAYCGVRTAGFMYAQYATGEEELYDLSADPYELQNVADDPGYAATLGQLRTQDHAMCNPVPPGFTWSH